jgi:hypothetical protein
MPQGSSAVETNGRAKFVPPPPPVESLELIADPLAGRKAKPVHWLVDRKIPAGKLTMVASVGGLGKSTLIRHLVACLTTGRPAFGLAYQPPPPCEILLASVEDTLEDTVTPHLLAEGADLTKVLAIAGVRKPDGHVLQFDLRDLDCVMAKLQARPSIKLLVIDPIMSFVGRAGLSENASAEVRLILDPLLELAANTGLAIIMIAHLTKSTTTAAVNRIVGSSAFRDASRVVYAIGKDLEDDNRRVMALVKANVPGLDKSSLAFSLQPVEGDDLAAVLNAPEFSELSPADRDLMGDQLARVVPLGRVLLDADEALGTDRGSGTRESNARNCAIWLRERIGTNYAWPDEEIERNAVEAGFTVRQFRRAKNQLKPSLQVAKIGFQGKWYVAMGSVRELPIRPDNLAHGQNGQMGQNGDAPILTTARHSDQSDHAPDIWPDR